MLSLRSAQSRAIAAGALGLLLLASVAAVAGMAATTDQTGRSTLWLVIGLSAAAFVVVAATVAGLIVWTTRPLAALQASARAITAGDAEARARVSGPEEVASLARDFNAMTDALLLKTEVLQQSEVRYRLLAENVTDVIWTLDTNLRFTYVSPSVTRLRGDTVEEMVGRKLKEILTPASLEAAMEVFAEERAIEERQDKDPLRSRTLELEQICKDGSTAWAEAKLTILRDPDDQPIGILGITRDITERKRAEEALRASKVLLDKTFASLGDALFVVDPSTRTIATCNAAVEHIFGYGLEELVGRSTEFLHVNRQTYEEFGRRGFPVLDAHGVFAVEYEMRRKDGTVFPTEHVVTEILDDSGRRTGVVSVVRDITDRKRAEEALRESEDRHRAMFEQAADSLVLVDAETGELVQFNDKAHQNLGYTREEFERLEDTRL